MQRGEQIDTDRNRDDRNLSRRSVRYVFASDRDDDRKERVDDGNGNRK
jgi:hypothetical protein